MLSYDQAAAKKQWREAVRAVAEAIEDAGGVSTTSMKQGSMPWRRGLEKVGGGSWMACG